MTDSHASPRRPGPDDGAPPPERGPDLADVRRRARRRRTTRAGGVVAGVALVASVVAVMAPRTGDHSAVTATAPPASTDPPAGSPAPTPPADSRTTEADSLRRATGDSETRDRVEEGTVDQHGNPVRAGSDRLEAAAEAVDVLGKRRYSRRYTAVTMDSRRSAVVLYRKPPAVELDRAARASAGRYGLALHLRDTAYTWAELRQVSAVAWSRREALRARGVELNTTGIGRPFQYVEVRVDGDLSAARDLLADLGARVRIVPGGQPAPAAG